MDLAGFLLTIILILALSGFTYFISRGKLEAEPMSMGSPVIPGATVALPSPSTVPSPVCSLNVAAPELVTVQSSFEIALKISHSMTKELHVQGLGHVQTGEISPIWPDEGRAVDLRAQVYAPGCQIKGESFQMFRLEATRDSTELYFDLLPLHQGDLSIRITIYQSLLTLGSVRLTLFSTDRSLDGQAWHGNSTELVPPDTVIADNHLYSVLDRAFSLAEIQELCYELGIDFENLPGQTKQIIARQLISYCRRRNRVANLVDRVLILRPNWLVQA